LRRILALDMKGSERFAAFQTNPIGSGRDQPTEWTHSLGSNLLRRRRDYRPELLEHIRDGGQSSAESIVERASDGLHRFTFFIFRLNCEILPPVKRTERSSRVSVSDE
jgi:hypothetical protein